MIRLVSVLALVAISRSVLANEGFMSEHWSQTKPYNDLVPAYLPPNSGDTGYEAWGGHVTAGCVATAMAQAMHYWNWPTRFDKAIAHNHHVTLDPKYDEKGNLIGYKTEFFATQTVAAGTPLVYDDSDACKARLTFIATTLGELAFDRDGTGGYPSTVANALSDYYEAKPTPNPKTDERMYYVELRNYLELGYPVPATIQGHAVVLHGYKIDEKGNEYYYMNNGNAGSGDRWIDKATLKTYVPCFPKKMARLGTVPKKSKLPLTVTWSFPEAYLKIYPEKFKGFELIAVPSSSKGTPEIKETLGRNVRSYTFEKLTNGETYSIEITPIFDELEGTTDPTVFISPVTSSVMTKIGDSAGDSPRLTAPKTAAIKTGEGGEIRLIASKDVENIEITPSLKSYTIDETTYELAKYLSVEGKEGEFTVKIAPIDFLGKSDNYNVVLTFKGTVPDPEGTVPVAEAYAETIVTFSASGEAPNPGTEEKPDPENPGTDLGGEGTDPDGEPGTDPEKQPDYILISPKDFVADWTKYVENRKSAHSDLTFAVKNAADIYATYGDKSDNPAEMIKAYIALEAGKGTRYFVLGGAWSDISSIDGKCEESFVVSGTNGDKYGQIALSLDNTIPGWQHAYTASNKSPPNWTLVHDYDYSLVDEDKLSDVVIARIPIVPWPKKDGSLSTFSEIIAGYGKKVAAVESNAFVGRHRYACAGASAVSEVSKGSEFWPNERHQYADGYYDFFDGRHPDAVADGVIAARRRFRDFFAMNNPIKGAMVIPVGNTAAEFFADIKGWEAVIAKCHGLEGSAYGTGLDDSGFRETSTLVKFGIFAMPCLTGRPDRTTTWNGMSNMRYPSMGVAAICNPNGGEVVGFHNAHDGAGRYDLAKVLKCEDPYSTQYEGCLLSALFEKRLNAGDAWLQAHRDYLEKHGSDTWNLYTAREAMLYGDPLIKVSEIRDGEKICGPGTLPAKVLFK